MHALSSFAIRHFRVSLISDGRPGWMEHLWAILRQGLSFIATVLRVRTNSRSNDQRTYFRESHQEFAAAAGRTYFFRLEMNAKCRLIMHARSPARQAAVALSVLLV